MDEEERWTQKIAARESLAFIPYAQRMWNYALVNGLYPADAKQLKRDYGKTLSYGTLSGIFAVLYWNTYAMNVGIKNKWTRAKWSLSSYVLGFAMSVPWTLYFSWSTMSRSFMKQTLSTTISEWRHPTGLIQHELLPNPPSLSKPAQTANASTPSPL